MEQLILNVWDKTLVKKKRVYSLPLTRKREQSCLTSWNRQKTLIVFLQLTFFGLMRGFIHPFFICKIGVCSQFNTNLSTVGVSFLKFVRAYSYFYRDMLFYIKFMCNF